MLSLFIFKRENAFRLYALLFIAVVFVERHFIHEISYHYGTAFHNDFFAYNYLRALLLLIPFILFSIFQRKQWTLKEFISNSPFFFLSCSLLTLPYFQWVYIALFIVNCAFIKELRIISVGALLTGFIQNNIPDIISSHGGAKNSSIKANAHMFQTILKTYALDWQGKLPESAVQIKAVASAENYWKNFSNPRNTKYGYGLSFNDILKDDLRALQARQSTKGFNSNTKLDILGIRLYEQIPSQDYKGMILYYRVNSTSYLIYAVNHKSNTLLSDGAYKSQPFMLSNS